MEVTEGSVTVWSNGKPYTLDEAVEWKDFIKDNPIYSLYDGMMKQVNECQIVGSTTPILDIDYILDEALRPKPLNKLNPCDWKPTDSIRFETAEDNTQWEDVHIRPVMFTDNEGYKHHLNEVTRKPVSKKETTTKDVKHKYLGYDKASWDEVCMSDILGKLDVKVVIVEDTEGRQHLVNMVAVDSSSDIVNVGVPANVFERLVGVRRGNNYVVEEANGLPSNVELKKEVHFEVKKDTYKQPSICIDLEFKCPVVLDNVKPMSMIMCYEFPDGSNEWRFIDNEGVLNIYKNSKSDKTTF